MTASVRKSACCFAPSIHDNVTCSVMEGGFSHPKPVFCRHCGGRTLYRWAVYEEGENSLLLKSAAQKVTEVRTGRFCKKDLQAKIRQQCHCTDRRIVTELPSRISAHGCGTNCTSLLKRISGVEPVAEHRPIARILFFRQVLQFSPYRGPSFRLLSHLEDVYGEAWSASSFFVMLADRISGEYSQVWDNWSRASERDRSRQKAVE